MQKKARARHNSAITTNSVLALSAAAVVVVIVAVCCVFLVLASAFFVGLDRSLPSQGRLWSSTQPTWLSAPTLCRWCSIHCSVCFSGLGLGLLCYVRPPPPPPPPTTKALCHPPPPPALLMCGDVEPNPGVVAARCARVGTLSLLLGILCRRTMGPLTLGTETAEAGGSVCCGFSRALAKPPVCVHGCVCVCVSCAMPALCCFLPALRRSCPP